MSSDDLLALKDDMVAFIEGHGMRHFPAVIADDLPRVWWHEKDSDSMSHPSAASESWKDFVEMAKAVGAPMVCIGEDELDKQTLEILAEEIEHMSESDDEFSGRTIPHLESLQGLFLKIGKVGHLELAFAHQGVLFVHETSTGWYRDYREMVETVDDLQELIARALNDSADEEND